ncbi:MAG: 6-phosphogluconolactonase [Bacteroidales bacterium]
MEKENIKVFKNIDQLSVFLGEQMINLINQKQENDFLSIALSGGSTPKAIFRYLSVHFREKIDWKKILFFWGDERCVSPDNEESNYKMTRESLFNFIPVPDENIFRVFGENEPFAEAERYSEIAKNKLKTIDGVPCFDLMLLGLGDDGHTASIFPGNDKVIKTEKIYDVAQNPYSGQKRITATLTTINASKKVIFLVTGQNKSEMVFRILNEKETQRTLPASMINPQSGELFWFLDEMAAKNLKL